MPLKTSREGRARPTAALHPRVSGIKGDDHILDREAARGATIHTRNIRNKRKPHRDSQREDELRSSLLRMGILFQ